MQSFSFLNSIFNSNRFYPENMNNENINNNIFRQPNSGSNTHEEDYNEEDYNEEDYDEEYDDGENDGDSDGHIGYSHISLDDFLSPFMVSMRSRTTWSSPSAQPASQVKPTVAAQRYDTTTKFNDTCSICYEAYKASDMVSALDCKHIFHEKCLQDWVNTSEANKRKCPLCRKRIFKNHI